MSESKATYDTNSLETRLHIQREYLWIPDLNTASLRSSGTTSQMVAYEGRISQTLSCEIGAVTSRTMEA